MASGWPAAALAAIRGQACHLSLIARFTIVGAGVGLVLAGAVARFFEDRVTELVLDQVAARAIDQAQLGVLDYTTAADFVPPYTPDRMDELASRLNPLLSRVREAGSGVIRLHVFGADGTVIYSDLPAKRGQVIAPERVPLLAAALSGSIGTSVSSLTSPENRDLKQRYGGALEVYVPVFRNGRIVGAYEIYQDLAPLRPIRPLVWGTTLGGFVLLFLALLAVVWGAARRLERQQHELIRGVAERERLEEQVRQSQKMEAIGLLAGGIAHDFNNLLTAILGFTELLIARLPPDDPRRAYAQEVSNAGERAASLTRQLLAFSRRQTLQPRVLNLNTVVASMDQLLRRVIGEDIHLLTRMSADLGLVEADPGQIEQVILNLAVNARDAMPMGGTLTIETQNIDLDAAYVAQHVGAREGQYVMVAVSDTGVGMDQETQARIFEPFFTTKGEGRGTGLGLSTVYGIVKQSGGNIWVYSEPGKGTTFRVYLPRLRGGDMPTPVPLGVERDAGGSETVLVVEDEPQVRALLTSVLEAHGYRVHQATSGPDALQLVVQLGAPVDLLITDMVMPGMGGRELAEQIQQRFPQTKVLYTSGFTPDSALGQRALPPGTALLQKPFTSATLARKAREVLDAPNAAERGHA